MGRPVSTCTYPTPSFLTLPPASCPPLPGSRRCPQTERTDSLHRPPDRGEARGQGEADQGDQELHPGHQPRAGESPGPLAGRAGPRGRCLTSPSRRPRSWWSPCPRKSKPTSPRPRRRRSRRPWRPWAAPWFWSRPAPGLVWTGVPGTQARPTARPSAQEASGSLGAELRVAAPLWDTLMDLPRREGPPRLSEPAAAGLWTAPPRDVPPRRPLRQIHG